MFNNHQKASLTKSRKWPPVLKSQHSSSLLFSDGIQEVAGSIPTTSTTEITELRNFAKLFFVFSKNFSKNIATAGSFGHCITYLHIVLLFSIMDLQTIAR